MNILFDREVLEIKHSIHICFDVSSFHFHLAVLTLLSRSVRVTLYPDWQLVNCLQC